MSDSPKPGLLSTIYGVLKASIQASQDMLVAQAVTAMAFKTAEANAVLASVASEAVPTRPPLPVVDWNSTMVHVAFDSGLEASDKTWVLRISIPGGGVKTFNFKEGEFAVAEIFTTRVNNESGGKLIAHFNPLQRHVVVRLNESEIQIDEPTESNDDETMGVRALWSALRNNRGGMIVINSSTKAAANTLIDWGLAKTATINRITRSELADELFTLEVVGDGG